MFAVPGEGTEGVAGFYGTSSLPAPANHQISEQWRHIRRVCSGKAERGSWTVVENHGTGSIEQARQHRFTVCNTPDRTNSKKKLKKKFLDTVVELAHDLCTLSDDKFWVQPGSRKDIPDLKLPRRRGQAELHALFASGTNTLTAPG